MKTNKIEKSLAKYLLDSLYQNNVGHVFGVPGDYVLSFDKRIEEHPIRFINTTRESTAGYMADAYGRMKGLGVACITYGVGINIVNALAQAFVENSPLIVISGAPAAADLQKGIRLHHLIGPPSNEADLTQLEIFKPVTAAQAILQDPQQIKKQIDDIIALCLAIKKPVYIEIPRDRIDTPLAEAPVQKKEHAKSDSKSLAEALNAVEDILNRCRQPVIWAGHEIQRYGLGADLLRFAEQYNIPIATSLIGKGAINERHPLFLGVYQGNISRPEVVSFVNACDCILMLGLILTDVDTGIFTAKLDHEHRLAANADGIAVDGRSYRHLLFPEFLKTLPTIKCKRFQTSLTPPEKPPFNPQSHKKITTKRVFECIQSHLQPEHIVFADIGDSLFGSADLIVGQNGFLACAHYGSLGFAIPGSIGAQLAAPDRRVIALVGDGAFQMTCTELSTAVHYRIDPIVILLNNHGYGTERPILEGAYNDIQNWHYAELPRLLGGGTGVRVTTEEELEHALTDALSERGVFHLIEVELEKTDFSPTMTRFIQLVTKER